MTERTASFIQLDGVYYPANKNATAVAAILSRRTLLADHMLVVRSHGYTPRLTNGEEIGKLDVSA